MAPRPSLASVPFVVMEATKKPLPLQELQGMSPAWWSCPWHHALSSCQAAPERGTSAHGHHMPVE